MAIKGMTDQQEQLPIVGVLRKGAEKPKNGPGRDLEYFRFTSDDPEALRLFQETYADQPQNINVFLPYKTALENMDSWIELWVAGGLVYRSDGEHLVLYREGAGFLTISDTPDPKPDPKPGIVDDTGKRADGSQYVGRLSVIVPELGRLATVTALTTSKNDIIKLTRQLKAVEALTGDLRGVPFVLRRRLEKVSTPGKNGKRLRREKWMLTIETKPEWAMAKMLEQENLAMPQLPEEATHAENMIIEQIPANVEPIEQPAIIQPDEPEPANGNGQQQPAKPAQATNGNKDPWPAKSGPVFEFDEAVKTATLPLPENCHYTSHYHLEKVVGQFKPEWLNDPDKWDEKLSLAYDHAAAKQGER